ncbi:MAG: membrane protein insertion efficiency factor YidD [Desulfatiglandales bacterium]
MLALIKLYQIIVSPLLPPSCRFVPTCSTYAFLAINRYGILKGGSLTVMRLLKCHPFHAGGYDPLK